MSNKERIFVSAELDKLVKNGSIEEITGQSLHNTWFSPIFVVPKGQSFRLILNTKILNSYIKYRHFKLLHVSDILNYLTPGAYLAKIDWTMCFNHFPVSTEHQRFLCFQWTDLSGVTRQYRYKCCPNGVSCVPYIVNRACKPLLKFLASHCINLGLYINDSVLW